MPLPAAENAASRRPTDGWTQRVLVPRWRLLRARAVPAAVLLGCLAAGAPAPAAVAARLPSTRVFVTPGVGHPQTSFALRFRIPVATGTFGSVIRRDTLSVSGPRHAGCVSSVATTLRFAKRGTRMKVMLKPGRRGGSWCAGQFRGQISSAWSSVALRSSRACPYLLVAPLTIARFRFRVAPAAAGGPAPAGGPTFAGLISATTCNSLAPQVLPRPTSYTLIWKAATDPITPSSALVYECSCHHPGCRGLCAADLDDRPRSDVLHRRRICLTAGRCTSWCGPVTPPGTRTATRLSARAWRNAMT